MSGDKEIKKTKKKKETLRRKNTNMILSPV